MTDAAQAQNQGQQPIASATPSQAQASAAPAPRAGVIADGVYNGLPPDQQDKFAMVRKPGDQGGSEWVSRAALENESGSNPDTGAQGDRVKIGELEVSQAELQDYFQSKAAADLRKASLPQTPADYKADLPPDFQMPAGITDFKFDTTDPLFTSAQAWAHSRQIDQGTFSEMVGLYASAKATEAAQLNAAHTDQVAKMGANGPMRVTALETWLRGIVGDDRIAGQMKNMLVTADIVKGMERIQARMSSQGAASFSQAHREPGDAGGTVSDEAYAKMSPAARLDYARSFDQKQFSNAFGNPR